MNYRFERDHPTLAALWQWAVFLATWAVAVPAAGAVTYGALWLLGLTQ